MTREHLKEEALNAIAELEAIAAEYSQPDSLIDSGNWYYIAGKLVELAKKQDSYIDSLLIEFNKYKSALEDIGYIKTWIVQNKPMELVKIALTALRKE